MGGGAITQSLQGFPPLGLALAIGLLIGLERGWQHRADADGSRVAGIRTFGILGLIGGVCGSVAVPFGAIGLLTAAVALLIGYVRQRALTPNVSATNILTGLLTLMLGYLAVTGRELEAMASGVAVSILLSMREEIHGWLRVMTAAEVQAISRFALLCAVILPLLPDAQFGPLDAWNPRKIWLVVVFVSGFSLLGYVASRRLGSSAGLLATAFTGALVSSTAVTASLSRRLREGTADSRSVTAGIALASAVMFVRICVVTAVLVPFAFPVLVLLMLPAGIVAILLAALSWRRSRTANHESDMKLGNPFDIRPALLLAGLVALLSLGVRWAQIQYGDVGIAALLALTGLADVDAAVMALATLPVGAISAQDAGLALAAPVLLNTAFKGVIVIVICPDRRGLRAATPLFVAVVVALVPILIGLPDAALRR